MNTYTITYANEMLQNIIVIKYLLGVCINAIGVLMVLRGIEKWKDDNVSLVIIAYIVLGLLFIWCANGLALG